MRAEGTEGKERGEEREGGLHCQVKGKASIGVSGGWRGGGRGVFGRSVGRWGLLSFPLDSGPQGSYQQDILEGGKRRRGRGDFCCC